MHLILSFSKGGDQSFGSGLWASCPYYFGAAGYGASCDHFGSSCLNF